MSIPSWAKVGAKVVCINPSGTHQYNIAELERRGTYTIRQLDTWDGRLAAHLEEISERPVYTEGKISGWRSDVPFRLDRFRPLITRTQDEDVDAFKSLLQDMPLTERLDRIGELLG